MVAQFFGPCIMPRSLKHSSTFHQKLGLHLPQRGGWWESSLAGADKLQACTIYSRELEIPFTLHYLQTGQNHR
jgi:hypothetical protein